MCIEVKCPMEPSRNTTDGLWLRLLISILFFSVIQSQPGNVSIQEIPKGGKLFRAQCFSCHGSDCKGKAVRTGRFALGGTISAPDLTTGPWKYGSQLIDIQRVVTEGRGKMPAFGKKITEENIRDVSGFFRYLCDAGSRKNP